LGCLQPWVLACAGRNSTGCSSGQGSDGFGVRRYFGFGPRRRASSVSRARLLRRRRMTSKGARERERESVREGGRLGKERELHGTTFIEEGREKERYRGEREEHRPAITTINVRAPRGG
jgi:hypothetical protein